MRYYGCYIMCNKFLMVLPSLIYCTEEVHCPQTSNNNAFTLCLWYIRNENVSFGCCSGNSWPKRSSIICPYYDLDILCETKQKNSTNNPPGNWYIGSSFNIRSLTWHQNLLSFCAEIFMSNTIGKTQEDFYIFDLSHNTISVWQLGMSTAFPPYL